jgi:hypothetical protein
VGHRRSPSPETIGRLRASAMRYWSDPAVREQHSELMKRRMARLGVIEKIANRTREAMSDPKVRQRIRDGMARAKLLRQSQAT